ncbi:MAG: GNAT family N-acetyltransferase [Chlamydiales bacterium]
MLDQTPPQIVYSENALPEDMEAIRRGVLEEAATAGMGDTIPFAFTIKDHDSHILAGATGCTMYGFLFTEWLWVERNHRHKKWGSQLLKAIEELGKKRHCSASCLFTMSWEALGFYQKHGYQIELVREGFEKNAKMYMLRKSLL